MPNIGANARLLSNDVLARWLIEDFPFRIQLAPVFPFYPLTGHELRYATTPSLRPGVALDFSAAIPEDTKHPNDPNRVFPISELATSFRITYRAQDVFSSNVNDQTAVQMALAVRELLYRFWTLFESGDATRPGEFDGLDRLVDPAQVIDLKGEALSLETLEAARERVRSNDGRGAVIFTSSVGKRAIHAAHWVRGLGARYREISFPSPAGGGRSTEEVVTFDGAPVHVNDLNLRFLVRPEGVGEPLPPTAPDDPRAATNIWFFVLGENNLHGIHPAGIGSSMFISRSTILADGSETVHHVTMPTGIALGSSSGLSVIRNATIPRGADHGR